MLPGVATRRRRIRTVVIFCLTAVLTLVISAWATQLWESDIHIPFGYDSGGDLLFYQMIVKSIGENGWFLSNPQRGAPGVQELYTFPNTSILSLSIMKALGFVFRDSGVVLNIFYLVTFPLIALAALSGMRSLGVPDLIGVVCSILYACLPAHFLRGEWHPFLAAYFAVPLVMTEAVRLAKADSHVRTVSDILRARWLPMVGICFLAGTSDPYYAFFSLMIFFAAGVLGWIQTGQPAVCVRGLMLSGTVAVVLMTALLPSLVHFHLHGNPGTMGRPYSDSEIYALKLIQLVLPVHHHRIERLADVQARYTRSAPQVLVNENVASTLGFVAAVGFVFLILVSLGLRPRSMDLDNLLPLANLNLVLILVATVGGVGAVFSFLFWSQIRAYNRLSVFIAFVSLVAVGHLVSFFCRRWHLERNPLTYTGFVVVIAGLGLLDQMPPGITVPKYEADHQRFEVDRMLGQAVERFLPDDAMVFQLPYVPFPEGYPVRGIWVHDHIRPYLHTSSIRYSSGAPTGGPADTWQRKVSALPPEEILISLNEAGFKALLLDTAGYEAHEDVVNGFLQSGASTLYVGQDGRHVLLGVP